MTELEEFAKLYEENGNDFDLDHDDLEVIQDGDWVQDHKYQYRDSVVRFKGKFLMISESRSGSYHTDWYYDDSTIQEVERHEKVVTTVTWKGLGEKKEIPSRY